ncbi:MULTISPECIES: PPOX class F420-dependent oxidoreductase [unclassified Mycolicibacterium]|uniref:PPOX class F420-dependent oxidoreductase n=1 Tax=unclassified Mycolicibacterium TaxID=2636767 RepID=UPI0012DF0A00|nr:MULTISPECIES: PPOX class F420-dependent oxidoreductase [unclassified Mycolicibacterium]MUL84575.1 PPOX class F420-dependent oxidoreductase [Mycolicibacterium sp. CBMA 329]MUL88350.1 PPOX class F420-dependent oxidoreductase [Mycolicibacterium sp. CBMA 331]MUL99201.1 PPOX class F420-dependent oxidoreductase [Mycolicibacterium sp. CBMA 334]MUM25038.1 PPOX class F420-dependent oxidoreductase [Mycolicibacterium sp. CBMA 295]MUM39997.1 PPOX class F420-dependent oxidoreductase [Mycolicibacterium s
MPHPDTVIETLGRSQYALLRSFRRDGTAVDTPIWFLLDDRTALFRTKIGPKTRRLAARPDVELTVCDYRGRITGTTWLTGRATVLDGDDAQQANDALHRRYGWHWNVMPLVKLPGVTNVHRDLPLREKLRRARHRDLWPDSAIVQIDLDPSAGSGAGS